MIYLGYAILAFALYRLVIAFINFISFHFLPNKVIGEFNDHVSILIPARNEEHNIDQILEDLSGFSYSNMEILIYDDQSDDDTVQIINAHIAKNNKIRLIPGTHLPDGWLGKNHACQHLAREAKGDYLLFIDADIRVKNGLLERALQYSKRHKLQLLSIFPRHIIRSPREKKLVPLINWILLSFFPLPLIRLSRDVKLAAANGQFMLFESSTYKELMPHKQHSAHVVEDIAIMQYYKKQKLKVDALLGNQYISCRIYQDMERANKVFTASLLQFFGKKKLLALLFALITTIGPLLVFIGLGYKLFLVYIGVSIMLRVFISAASRQNILMNLFYMIPQHINFIAILVKIMIKPKYQSYR